MQKAVSDERTRFFAVLAIAIVVGLVIEQLAWSLAVAGICLAGYAIWQSARLLEWLDGGRKPPPANSGLWAETYSFMRRERRSSDSRRRKLLNVLRWYSDSADALPDAALILDEHHTIIGSNQAARHTLGINNKRDRGQRVDNLLRDPLLLNLLNDELPEPIIEMASPVSQGDTLRLRLTEYGEGTRLLLAQDISEQIRTQEMRQAFVANVSHELHTPLTVVNGHLELLLDDPDIEESQREQLLQVSRQSHRMQALVQDLLSLARLESAPTLTEGEPVDMVRLIEAEVDAIQHSNRFPDHQITTKFDQSLLVHGRQTELESVVHNLLVNAFRYTPAGTSVTIEWHKQPTGRPALLVNDTGDGIPAEHLPRLTERFYRVDSARSSDLGGTGLGLAIVKHVLQRHGGELQVDSQEGIGSQFTALFSAERAAAR